MINLIASRYLFSKRTEKFLPLLTTVSIAGVALGVFSLVIVLSVMMGFRKEVEKKLMGLGAHITLTRHEGSKDVLEIVKKLLPQGADIIPFAEGEAIAQVRQTEEPAAGGVKVRGIDPKIPGQFADCDFYFPEGSSRFEGLSGRNSLPGIILGSEILPQLMVHPDFENIISLVAPLAEVGPAGDLIPRERTYKLIGALHSGIYQYDSKLVLVSIEEAKRLLGAQVEEGWQIILPNPSDAAKIAEEIARQAGSTYKVETWQLQNSKLFAALKLERIAMLAILLLIILIASFSIIGVITMSASTKRKDIAILRSMGTTSSSIGKIFLTQGLWIGLAGSIIGASSASLVCIALIKRPIRLPSSYYLNFLPVDWSLGSTIFFALSGIAIALAASLYPAINATKDDPIIRLRYE